MTVQPVAPGPGRRDLRTHPDWAQLRATTLVAGWTIESWEEPVFPGETSLDATLVGLVGGRLRCATIDGIQNRAIAHGTTNAQHAVATVRGHLACNPDPVGAITAAARQLCDPDLRPRQRNPEACLAGVDVDLATGEVVAYRAGDCEVWVRRNGSWSPVFPGDMLTPFARAAYDKERDSFGDPVVGWWEVQERLLDDPASWTCPPVGLIVNPVIEQARIDDAEAIIVSSDGACLTPDRCAELDHWLSTGVQIAEPGWVHRSPHGDLSVLRLTPPGR